MKKILENLALIDLLNFCKANNIDCSGTHLVKNGRGYNYGLVKDSVDQQLVNVIFYPDSVPKHFIHNS